MLTERNPVELPLVDVGDLVVVPADRRTRGRLKDVPARERDRVIKEQKCGRGDIIGGFPFVLPTLIMRGGGVTRRLAGVKRNLRPSQQLARLARPTHDARFIPASEVFFRRAKWENKGAKIVKCQERGRWRQ